MSQCGLERDIALDGTLDAAQRARLLAIANRCPVHLTLSSQVNIRANVEWEFLLAASAGSDRQADATRASAPFGESVPD